MSLTKKFQDIIDKHVESIYVNNLSNLLSELETVARENFKEELVADTVEKQDLKSKLRDLEEEAEIRSQIQTCNHHDINMSSNSVEVVSLVTPKRRLNGAYVFYCTRCKRYVN